MYQRLALAEEAIYTDSTDPMVNWDLQDLQHNLQNSLAASNFILTIQLEQTTSQTYLSSTLLERWFAPKGERPTYANHLSTLLSNKEIATIRDLFFQQLANQRVDWENTVALIYVHD